MLRAVKAWVVEIFMMSEKRVKSSFRFYSLFISFLIVSCLAKFVITSKAYSRFLLLERSEREALRMELISWKEL